MGTYEYNFLDIYLPIYSRSFLSIYISIYLSNLILLSLKHKLESNTWRLNLDLLPIDNITRISI